MSGGDRSIGRRQLAVVDVEETLVGVLLVLAGVCGLVLLEELGQILVHNFGLAFAHVRLGHAVLLVDGYLAIVLARPLLELVDEVVAAARAQRLVQILHLGSRVQPLPLPERFVAQLL